jgi:4-hydroxybenzoate polyprenyltransferase
MNTLKGIVSLTRPYILFTTTSFYIAATFLGINGIPALVPFFIGFFAVALAIASAHTLNDYFDREEDQNNPRTAKRAIPSGLVSPRLAFALGVTYGVIAVSLTFFLNPLCVLLAFIAIPLPFTYVFLRKRQIPYSFLCTMLAVLLIILLGSAVASGTYFPNYMLLFIIFGVSWEMGRTLISEIQDVDYDKLTNVSTISLVVSSKQAARLILCFFSIATVMSIIIGILGQLGIIYLGVTVGASVWLTYRSLELIRTPTTPNAIQMRIRAPKYLVTICLILVVTLLLNTLLSGL